MDIFLQKYKSKRGVNSHATIGVDIKGEKRLVPIEPIISTLNELDQYNAERQSSTTLRLVCKVATVCSNILHNMVTEVVFDEGSSGVCCYNFTPNEFIEKFNDNLIGRTGFTSITQLIDDTQCSSNDKCTYHCGFDMLSNHTLRCKNFKTVTHIVGKNNTNFNTISDTLRLYNGRDAAEYVWNADGLKKINGDSHLYISDDLMTFQESIEQNRLVSDGWIGFTNKSAFHTVGENKDSSNETFCKVINNKEACDFVDFYPERDLFSFAPKYNPFYHRIEKNWNYCITYPYSSITEGISFIDQDNNSIHCLLKEFGTAYNGAKSITLTSIPCHGLSVGNVVNIYLDGKLAINLSRVIRIVDEYTFVCYNDGLEIDISLYSDDGKLKQFSYKRCINGREVEYYVRLFKKLPNINRLSSSGTPTYEFQNSINKLAFSKSIYNDDVAEVVFTDDIDYDCVKDNLGRPLTELYFTIVKNNKGHKEWYDKNNWNSGKNSQAKEIEYSHCFGKINCAFKLSESSPSSYGSVTTLTNVSAKAKYGLSIINILEDTNITQYGVEDSIEYNPIGKYGGNNIFYGDLCCYSDLLCEEQSIQMIDFRFNTHQREDESLGWTLNYTELAKDDFDGGEFTATSLPISDTVKPEGYYYKPHYQIPIRTFSQSVTQRYGLKLTVKKRGLYVGNNDGNCDIPIMENGVISTSMDIRVLSLDNEKVYYGHNIKIVSPKRFQATFQDENGNAMPFADISSNRYVMFIKPVDVPDYASFSYDASCLFFWRELIPNGYDTSNSIESYPFTNGSLYVMSDIRLFLKRQDASGINGLYEGGLSADLKPSVMSVTEKNNYVKEEDIKC